MTQAGRLSFGRLAAFSLPVVLFQAIELGWRTYLPAFLSGSVGISLAMIGVLMMAARTFDAASDPIIGWLSDHAPSRCGHRKPWMAAGAPLVSIGALALFLAPTGSSIAFVVAASLTLHLGYSLIITPHGGWGLELADDKHERTRIMGAKVWFGSAGAIATLLLLAILERELGFSRAALVATLGLVIAVLAPLSVGIVLALFREAPVRPGTEAPRPLAALASMARDPGLRRVILLYLLTGIADASGMGTFLFLCDTVLGLGGWGASLMLLQPVLLLFTLPIWSEVSRRWGRERTLSIAYAWQALVMPVALLLPVGGLLPFAAFLMLRNLTGGVDYMLLRAMVADVVGAGADRGLRLGGTCYALTGIALKIAMGAGAAGTLWAIGLAGFQPQVPPSDVAQLAVRMAYALPTTAAAIAGLLILRQRRSATGALQLGS